MSFRYPAGLLTAASPVNAQYPSGVWTQQQAAQYQAQGVFATDPNFRYTTMLLNGNGTNGAQNNTFLDSSTNNFSITRNGNTTQGTFNPYVPSGFWSNYFGTTQYKLSTTGMTALGSDFTLEVWIFPTAFNDYNTIFDNRTSDGDAAGVVLGLTSAAKVYFYTNAGFQITTTTAVSANTWTHIALVRNGSGGGNVKIYINGTADATTATYTTSFTRTAPSIGCDWNTRTNLQYYGYLSNMRATSAALYTGSFTPSTVPLTTTVSSGTCLLLTCQANRFIDSSASALAMTVTGSPSVQSFQPFPRTVASSAAVTGGSGYFDGTGDYLATPTLSTIGSGDFSQEAWVYTPSNSGTPLFWDAGASAGTFLLLNGSTSILGGINGSTAVTATYTLPLNCWNHLVYCRSGTTVSIFANGTRVGTATAGTSAASGSYYIGIAKDATRPFTGYMCGTRFVHGASAYDATASTITVPTAPVTAITNTQLLLSYTNAGIQDSAMANDLETVGNAQVSTSVVKYGTGSLYFDGTGDWLKLRVNDPTLTFGSGDFTVEGWVYLTSTSGNQYFVVGTCDNATVAGSSFDFGLTGVNGNIYIGSSTYTATAPTPTLNTWCHVAYVRYGTSFKTYLNGTQVGSTTLPSGGVINAGTTNPGAIGANGAGTAPLFGYIDDLRITKGLARYTANFTPPIAPFPKQ